ncbi:diguanylate cyclase [Paracidovorax citrulli]|uniref:Diguanylate cyclase with PAS/PAC sensor n=2 Tax=Paracidovorax citrulli TaxID=80869 RepID=A1TNT8_PARC0|nr:diguanylate cyclase [Paracidovorax citrulli]ABM32626.1 diguanylate cyclase with PAS/PAC sensor [Paracidovorax citrulli AAC00-1]ATG93362.1 GGDEF domain-containing protein [Paracidovorax citrulli]MVT36923.1 diguanylate cyclase [Paracidovorax citrulli]PVY66845.1 PAS domain S-box-containing protein/diguanylate cyclase (GGDEF)-like protein [Paracidovorax citrulli]QCX09251.1 putative diguanylate cyclase YegE [Paracidovorax citrulli]
MTPNELPLDGTLSAVGTPPGLPDSDMLQILTRNVGATVAVVSRALRVVYVNDEYARWFRAAPEAIVGKSLIELYGEYNYSRFMPYVQRVLAGERVSYQRLVLDPEGRESWRTICVSPWRDAGGGIAGFVTAALDVDELQVAMNALRAANQRLSSHMDNSPLAVLEMDDQLRVLRCSRRAIELMGWQDLVQVECRRLHELPGTSAMEQHLSQAFSDLRSGRTTRNRVESCLRRADGSEVHCEWFSSALTDEGGRVTSIMSLVQDISAKIEIARQQHYLANHDSLTGLQNRSAFQSRFEHSLARVRSRGGAVALLFIDLDGFKKINDGHGHKVGDEVLRCVARRLAHAVRGSDTVARLGGDEFLVMLDTGVEADLVGHIGARIISALAEPMEVDGHAVRVGASIGVAMHPPLEGDIELLMTQADQAMYAAKRTGRGCMRYAGQG